MVRRATTLAARVLACSALLAGSAHAQDHPATDLAVEHSRPLLGNASFGPFTFRGRVDEGRTNASTASTSTFDDRRQERFDSQAFGEARYEDRFGLTDVVTSVRYDRHRYLGQYLTSMVGVPAVKVDIAHADSIGSSFAITRRINSHHVAFGGEFRDRLQRNLGTHASDTFAVFLDVRDRSTAWAATMEDELKLHRNVVAHGAVRFDDSAGFGGRITPRGSLVIRPSSRTHVKALFGNEPGVELSLKTGADVGLQTLRTGTVNPPAGEVSTNGWVSTATVTKTKLPAGAELGATIYNLFDSAARHGRRVVGNLTWHF